MQAIGSSVKNGTTRVFESKHQSAKRTNTNRKESHLQQVRRQSVLLAAQHAARGDAWEALVLDPTGKGVIGVRRALPGPKLVELARSRHPSLNPHLSSLATVRDQGSSVSVRDGGVLFNMSLSAGRASCRNAHGGESSRRAAAVEVGTSPPAGSAPTDFLLRDQSSKNSRVASPPDSDCQAARLALPEATLPERWCAQGAPRAAGSLDVYSDAPPLDPGRVKLLPTHGGPGSGSCVSVNTPLG